MIVHWKSCSVTDAGKVRTHNEDSIYLNTDRQIWAVADGMGGHHKGDFASQTIVDYLNQYRATKHTGISLQRVSALLRDANETLLEKARLESVNTIASTCAVLTYVKSRIVCSWIGDSRIYRFRDGHLTLLTRDHNFETLLKDTCSNGQKCEHTSMNSQALTRGVGAESDLKIEHCHYFAKPGDRYLLCTDGLYKELSREELSSCFCTIACDKTLTDKLHKIYLQNGARDNLALIVISLYD